MSSKNENILHKLYNRQLSGRVGVGDARLCGPRQTWYSYPLKSIIDTHQALLKGHVLLGFLKDGIHIISYLCQVESSEVDILHSLYTYSVYIWRFDLGAPLQKVCTYPLFVGESITSDLHLVICETAANERLVVLGAAVQLEETARQCYVSLLPAPHIMMSAQHDPAADAYFVHFKYDVQPPYPPFIPALSLRIKDSILCNTGDSLSMLTVHVRERTPVNTRAAVGGSAASPAPSSNASHSSEGESDVSDQVQDTKRSKYICSCPALRSSEHLPTCAVPRMHTIQVASEYDVFSPMVPKKRRRMISSKKFSSQSPKILGDKKCSQVDTVTTFSCRLYGLSSSPTDQCSARYDATQTLYPILASSLIHGALRPTFTRQSESPIPCNSQLLDDFVTIKQASFDAELYLNSAISDYEALSARYLSLRDYDMRLLEVCQSSSNVLVIVMVLCIANHQCQPHKQVLISSGFILSWNVLTGAAITVECLPIEEFATNPCSVKKWNPGVGVTLDLRKRWFTPTDPNKSIRAFSNANVFSGLSLTKLFHPYLPVAINLDPE